MYMKYFVAFTFRCKLACPHSCRVPCGRDQRRQIRSSPFVSQAHRTSL